ncbi:MAG: hypothetical protein EHM77_04240 [Planctomycetaceae bacterium]|nr:MAG: hypothetical protein EHM77_04240 [Planctomycetaceae bacterium]
MPASGIVTQSPAAIPECDPVFRGSREGEQRVSPTARGVEWARWWGRRIGESNGGESGGQLAWLARSEETEGVIRFASRTCRGGLRPLPEFCPYLAIFCF